MTINTTAFTSGELEGTGIFDVTMKVAAQHLEREFNAERITGNDYTQAYIAMMGAAMSAATQFALQQELTAAQTAKTQAELDLIAAQILLSAEQRQATEAERLLTDQKTVTERAQVDDSPLNTGSVLHSQVALMVEQKLKVVQETALLAQKTDTEKAQIKSIGVDADSVIGLQKDLYKEQGKGFATDRKVKGAKLYADVFAIQLNLNEGVDTQNTGMSKSDLSTAMAKVQTSII